MNPQQQIPNFSPRANTQPLCEIDPNTRALRETIPRFNRIRSVKPKISESTQRLAIAFYYVQKLGAPCMSKWTGTKGTISKIIEGLGLNENSRKTVERVLVSVQECRNRGFEYTGERRSGSGGSNRLIEQQSLDSQIIADAMEECLGVRQTTALINETRVARGIQHVGVSAVYGAVQRLNPTYINNIS